MTVLLIRQNRRRIPLNNHDYTTINLDAKILLRVQEVQELYHCDPLVYLRLYVRVYHFNYFLYPLMFSYE